jgi:hypothetical protein
MNRCQTLVAITAVAVSSAGCKPFIAPVTSAPIDHEGRVEAEEFNDADDIIHVSKGAAIAVECRAEPWWQPCSGATARTENNAIARVLPAHLEKYRSPWGNTDYVDADSSHRSSFVVVGVDAGETVLHFETQDGNRAFHIVVEP